MNKTSQRPPADGQEQSSNEDNSCLKFKGVGDQSMTKERRPKTREEFSEDRLAIPSYLRWAQNLHNLLDDEEGVELYESYLKQEKCETDTLNFWFACQGLKKSEVDVDARISAIYTSFVQPRKVHLNPETTRLIKMKLGSKKHVDRTLFDLAQREIEETYLFATYLNFLKSDTYLHHVQKMEDCDPIQVSCANDDFSKENVSQLPTLHEDLELRVEPVRSTQSFCRYRDRDKYLEPVRTGSSHHNGFNRRLKNQPPCHLRYSGFQPTSAQDSELQSLSSDAQTEDTLSLSGSSSLDCGEGSKLYQKKQQRKMAKHNRDQLQHTVIPRTQRAPQEPPLAPEQFAAILIEKLNKLKKEIELQERLDQTLGQMEIGDSIEKMKLLNIALGGKVAPTHENDQSILDEHVSRVWDDSTHQTPNRSPGCRSPMQFCSLNRPRRDKATYESAFKTIGKKPTLDSSSSCVDSGVSVSEPFPLSFAAHEKVSAWVLKNEKYSSSIEGKNTHSSVSSSSPASSSRHSSSKKPLSYNASRHGSLDPGGSTPWPMTQLLAPAQPVAQDPSMPILPPPDTATQLMEAKRRLDIAASRGKSSRTKVLPGKEKQSEDVPHRKSGKKTSAKSEVTIIQYYYAGEHLSYLIKVPGKNVTLKQFKAVLNKKGNFRYFFKTTDNNFDVQEVVKEEITDDNEVLPFWEDKIQAIIEPIL